jgi:hypothetical protein
MLKKYQLDCHAASNGEEALERIDEKIKDDPCCDSC